MQLQVQALLAVSLGTQLLHSGVGGAENQLKVGLWGGGRGLGATGRWLGLSGPIQAHAATLRISL